MKRSDFINEISSLISVSYDDLQILMDYIEKHMLPPPKKVDIINDRLVYAYYEEESISEESEETNHLIISDLWDKE